MVDQNARERARGLLKKLALGRLTNYQCENEFIDLVEETRDSVIFALFRTVREINGHAEHSEAKVFSSGGEMRKRLCRWILFLKTELEYEWPRERFAPGLRDLYRPNWLYRLLRLHSQIVRSNERLFSHGDYQVWPFLRETDFNAARLACADRQRTIA